MNYKILLSQIKDIQVNYSDNINEMLNELDFLVDILIDQYDRNNISLKEYYKLINKLETIFKKYNEKLEYIKI